MKTIYHDTPLLRPQLQQWERTVLEKFKAKLKDQEQPFPCIPATIGFTKNHVRFGFTGDPRLPSTIDEVASLLSDYTNTSKEFGNYTSLIIFYETPPDLKDTHTVEMFEQLFWKQLSGLSKKDRMDWPNHLPLDPHNPIWEFCFQGEPYFMYCATPAHQNRKSRHFDFFMLAITPRWVLQEFNKNETFAKSIKAQIRNRLEMYDSIRIHPDLNSYGNKDNFEWKQYFLRDDESSLSKCPFHRLLNKNIE